MADNSGKVVNMARILSIVHIIVGFLLICFGIADRAVEYFWTGDGCYGIWIGVWMCIAGGLGVPGTHGQRSTCRNVFGSIFMAFSITSAVFGGIIIIFYSVAIAFYQDDYKYSSYNYYGPTRDYYYYHHYGPTQDYDQRRVRKDDFDAEMALSAIILILGIVEFAIGIWAAVCLCMMKPCTCYYGNPPQQGQGTYAPNSGYAMTQYPAGVPVAVPVQAGGMVPLQGVTTGPQTVMVPVSGMVGNQPQFAEVATSGAMATVYHPQLRPTYGRGGYAKMENEEFPVDT